MLINKYVLGLVRIISACAINAYAKTKYIEYNPKGGLIETNVLNYGGKCPCYSIITGRKKAIQTQEQEKIIVKSYLKNLLEEKGVCNKAEYFLLGFRKKDESGNPIQDKEGNNIIIREELILGCFKGEPGKYSPVWRINLDNMCHVSLYSQRENKVLVASSEGSYIIIDAMEVDIAKNLVETLNMYIPNNYKICKDYNNFLIREAHSDFLKRILFR